jgi:hypothetical protein
MLLASSPADSHAGHSILLDVLLSDEGQVEVMQQLMCPEVSEGIAQLLDVLVLVVQKVRQPAAALRHVLRCLLHGTCHLHPTCCHPHLAPHRITIPAQTIHLALQQHAVYLHSLPKVSRTLTGLQPFGQYRHCRAALSDVPWSGLPPETPALHLPCIAMQCLWAARITALDCSHCSSISSECWPPQGELSASPSAANPSSTAPSSSSSSSSKKASSKKAAKSAKKAAKQHRAAAPAPIPGHAPSSYYVQNTTLQLFFTAAHALCSCAAVGLAAAAGAALHGCRLLEWMEAYACAVAGADGMLVSVEIAFGKLLAAVLEVDTDRLLAMPLEERKQHCQRAKALAKQVGARSRCQDAGQTWGCINGVASI